MAALARRLGAGRLDVAEDAVQHALMRALDLWPWRGVPPEPEAWLAVVARNRALDLLRGAARAARLAGTLEVPPAAAPTEGRFERELNEDELALLFAVCHPVLSPEMRVTVALKTVAGLTVPQIAAGLLAEPTAIAQRLVRARRALEDADIPIETPPPDALPARAESVRTALWLMFNEGYSASSGESLVQPELCVEAIRLARALARHKTTRAPASDALAALLLLTAARLATRVGPDGVAQLLDDQPRAAWDASAIALGLAHLERSARGGALTVWHARAEIAALHATAPSGAATDWSRILEIYDGLLEIDASPTLALARAVAVGRARGSATGIEAVESVLPTLGASPYGHAAMATFLAELGRLDEARQHFALAEARSRTQPEQRLMARRRLALAAAPPSATAPPRGSLRPRATPQD